MEMEQGNNKLAFQFPRFQQIAVHMMKTKVNSATGFHQKRTNLMSSNYHNILEKKPQKASNNQERDMLNSSEAKELAKVKRSKLKTSSTILL